MLPDMEATLPLNSTRNKNGKMNQRGTRNTKRNQQNKNKTKFIIWYCVTNLYIYIYIYIIPRRTSRK